MAVQALGAVVQGVDAIPIEVEVDLLRRLPAISIVGLAQVAVKESAERVRSAITSAGLAFPKLRIVVNLAPADVRKEGTNLDLPLALGILAADGQLPAAALASMLAVGELALGGELRPIRGVLALATLARELGRTLVVPRACGSQAALVPGVEVRVADHLADVVAFARGQAELPEPRPLEHPPPPDDVDLADVRGQSLARFALEIAAAGAHHALLTGPPGCGKSMLARRLPTLLPPLTFAEALETTRVHCAAGLLPPGSGVLGRPFRAPHHSVTVAGLIGDRTLRPGEVSLAHHGVLFLDEATEFHRPALEVLREPLEDGVVHLTRARGSIEYPAALILVMASNPCPCGFLGTPPCQCAPSLVRRYMRKLSGPLLDRLDLHVALEPLSASELLGAQVGESSADVRARVIAAQERRRARGQDVPNGRLPAAHLERHAALSANAREVLHESVDTHRLSARAAMRLLRVARTIADLAGQERVEAEDIARSLAFRPAPTHQEETWNSTTQAETKPSKTSSRPWTSDTAQAP